MTTLVAALFLLTWPGQATPSRDAALAASRTIIAKAEFATLTSLNADGSPDSRIIDPLGNETVAPAGECIVHADVTAESVTKVRERFPFLQDRRG